MVRIGPDWSGSERLIVGELKVDGKTVSEKM
jgi:hypothetical protein